MGKSGYLFKSMSSVCGYVVSRSSNLSVFGDKVLNPMGWELVGEIELSADGLGRYVVEPEVALKELEEKYWYHTSLEDQRYIYLQ